MDIAFDHGQVRLRRMAVRFTQANRWMGTINDYENQFTEFGVLHDAACSI
jgi:hypothetical protein